MTTSDFSNEKRQKINDFLNSHYFLEMNDPIQQAFAHVAANQKLIDKLTDALFEALSTTQDYLILVERKTKDTSELQRTFIKANQAVQDLNWLICKPHTLPQQVCTTLMAVPVVLICMLFFGIMKSTHFFFEHLVGNIALPSAFIGAVGGFFSGLAEGAFTGYLATCQFNRFMFFNPAAYQIELKNTYQQLKERLDTPTQKLSPQPA